jgi:hypothetical protein
MHRVTLFSAVLCSSAHASLIVLPPSSATTATPIGLNTLTRSQGRTFQQVLPGDALGAGGNVLAGFTIRGAAFDINPTPTVPWPAAAISFASYEISIGLLAGNPGEPLNSEFADNIVPGSDVLVRSGAITIPAESWVVTSTPAGWGTFEFTFDTPFAFSSGAYYVMTVRHTGSGLTGAGADYFMESAAVAGVYQGAIVATSATASGGLDQGSYLVTRFNVIPAPGTGLFAVVGFAASRRRRR